VDYKQSADEVKAAAHKEADLIKQEARISAEREISSLADRIEEQRREAQRADVAARLEPIEVPVRCDEAAPHPVVLDQRGVERAAGADERIRVVTPDPRRSIRGLGEAVTLLLTPR